MPHDQQTYRKAANAALIGLAVQLVLSLGMWLLGIWAQSPVLYAATWHLVGGISIWVVLFLYYNQCRIERTEALEAEQLVRQDQQAAAIFNEHADDLDLAKRRLEKLHKYGFALTSLALACYLLILGLVFFYKNYQQLGSGVFEDSQIYQQIVGHNTNMMVMMFAAAVIAFLSFIIARFVSGMTGVREWVLLRGGASYLMGSFFISSLILIASLLDVGFGSRTFLVILAFVLPAIMILIGVEILLTFLLSAYRPRSAGEIDRPAFDSRVLGMLTSPKSLASIINETINYQFGFEVSKSWFYKLLGDSFTPLIIFGILLMALASTVVIVQPHEEALVLQFGKIVRTIGPGIHFKWCWPINSFEKHEVGRIHTITVGSVKSKTSPDVAILWTNQHTEGDEKYLISAPPSEIDYQHENAGNQIQGGTPGTSLIVCEVDVQYRIADLHAYVTSAVDSQGLLENLADRHVNEYFSSHDQLFLLTQGRLVGGEALKKKIQADVDAFGLGLEITFVGFTGVHPPQKSEVAKSFHDQVGAIQKRESLIYDAKKHANKILAEVAGSTDQALEIYHAINDLEALKRDKKTRPKAIAISVQKVDDLLLKASGQTAKIIYQARAYRWERAITERAKADKFLAELLAYRQAPKYYRARSYFNTLAFGLKYARKIIMTNKNAATPIIRIDLKDTQTGLGTLLGDK